MNEVKIAGFCLWWKLHLLVGFTCLAPRHSVIFFSQPDSILMSTLHAGKVPAGSQPPPLGSVPSTQTWSLPNLLVPGPAPSETLVRPSNVGSVSYSDLNSYSLWQCVSLCAFLLGWGPWVTVQGGACFWLE